MILMEKKKNIGSWNLMNYLSLQATILRPAVMVGTEDRILNPWAQFAKKYNFLPLIGGGSTKYDLVSVLNYNCIWYMENCDMCEVPLRSILYESLGYAYTYRNSLFSECSLYM